MQDRSPAWDDLIVRSHQIFVQVDVLVDNHVEYTVTNESSTFTEGQVTLDREDKIRGRGNVTFVDPTGALVPRDAEDLLVPYGTEWRAYRGVKFPNGVVEVKPLGVNVIKSYQVADTGDGLEVRLEGKDRSRKIKRSKFTRPWVVKEGTPSDVAIQDIIEAQVPGVFEYSMGGNDFATAKVVFEAGDDPWEKCQIIAQNAGCELFIDREGAVRMQVIPTVREEDSVWTFGEELSTVLNYQRDADIADDDGPNHILVTCEGMKPPLVVEAIDDNEDSPTYYLGPYGHVPDFYTSKQIVSETQGQAVANSMLNEALGRWEVITFNAIPNTALDLADVVTFDRPMSKLENVFAAIDVMSWPLTSKRAMEVLCRRRPI